MTTITDLVMRLVAAGAGPIEAAACIAEAHALGAASGMSGGSPVDKAAERRRAFDRKRKAEQRNKSADSGGSPVEVRGSPVEMSGNAPLSVLSLLPSDEPTEVKKERGVDVLNTEPREKVKRGARLPDDWQPSDVDMKFAAGRGLRLVEIEVEATKFRNYWTNRTDKQAAKPRWDRAWENWILGIKGTLNASNSGHRANPNTGPAQTHGDAVMAGMARYAARRRAAEPATARGTVCGRDDVTAEPDADERSAGGDREPPRQLAFMPSGDAGK